MTEPTSDQPKYFSFDRSFQEKILQAMLIDNPWAMQFAEVVDVNYFQFRYLKLVTSKYLDYYKQYKEFPTMDLLLTMIKGDLRNERDDVLRDQVKTFLMRVSADEGLGDLPFVKDKALEFCKKASLQQALNESVELIKTEKYDKIIEVVKTAIHAGNATSPGINLFEDVETRYSETFRKVTPTGINELDQRKILNGGLGAGELGVCVAPTGVGKSHFLVHVGAQALLHGKNVVHFTFELNERAMGIRYDSHILNINSLDCYDSREEIKDFYQVNKERFGGLRIKYYPTSTASCAVLRGFIEKLATRAFRPDLIIVDYAGIMRSSERYELLRLELKKVMEELRSLGTELDVPVWTAIQSNKEGANNDVVDLTNMAEGYGQAHVADFVVGLSRKSAEKATGFGNLFIAKNRAGIDGIKYKVHLDTAKSKLRILTDDEVVDLASSFEEDGFKIARQKLHELQEKKRGSILGGS